MANVFLQEVQATVVLADVRDFSTLAAQLGPVDLGVVLSRFYEHVANILEKHHGRLVKFVGDGVLTVFIGAGPIDHCGRALEAITECLKTRGEFLDENRKRKLPVVDYGLAASSGTVLAGELGTEKSRFYDILGRPVNLAFGINRFASMRGVSNLVDAATFEGVKDASKRPKGIETEGVELGGERVRLFKLDE